MNRYNYWNLVWQDFRKSKKGLLALYLLGVFFLVGLYAPLFASGKPLLVLWQGKVYSPLLRYLFYPGYYTKSIDLFYNLFMFTFPVAILGGWIFKKKVRSFFFIVLAFLHCMIFGCILSGMIKNPERESRLQPSLKEALAARKIYREDPLLTPYEPLLTWNFELKHLSSYHQLNLLLKHWQRQTQEKKLMPYIQKYQTDTGREPPILSVSTKHYQNQLKQDLKKKIDTTTELYQKSLDQLPFLIHAYTPHSHAYIMAKYLLEHASSEEHEKTLNHYQQVIDASYDVRTPLIQTLNRIAIHRKAIESLTYLEDKEQWLESENPHFQVLIPPFLRNFHWEEDAGGSQRLNSYLPIWELTRVNRKDLFASLLFGIRVSLMIGLTAVGLSLLIGVPLGMVAGYFGGKCDLIVCRFIEIWETMPTFLMLLLIVSIMHKKSIFLIVIVLGIFGWTTFCRFIRAETLKQRILPYVIACKSLGYPHRKIMFSHILPNAIPPVLTILSFSMMAAITSEAGISFLGLGEEKSTSWGMLMEEGRAMFPSESYLLWPPAILLTLLLVSIAIVGDTLRDAIDPKMRH
ncbi:MAG: ABC transporter permease subunit [Chlamydiales bacterium]